MAHKLALNVVFVVLPVVLAVSPALAAGANPDALVRCPALDQTLASAVRRGSAAQPGQQTTDDARCVSKGIERQPLSPGAAGGQQVSSGQNQGDCGKGGKARGR